MGTFLASSCTMARVQNMSENSTASEPSYEARGVGSSNLPRRTTSTIDWNTIAAFTLGRVSNFYLTKEDVTDMFPITIFPIPKSLYIGICEHAERVRNGLPKSTCRTQRRVINKQLVLHRFWKANEKRCYLCEKVCPHSCITRDHVFPKSEGYSIAGNMMPSCVQCNQDKAHKSPSLSHVRQAVALYKSMDRKFQPAKNKPDSALYLLRQLGVFS